MDTISYVSVTMQNNMTMSQDEKSWPKILVATTMTPILVLGYIGNVLSLLVWMKIRRCNSSTACFLAALAIADFIALLTGLNFWMSHVVKIDLRSKGSLLCKIIVYVDFSAQMASAWIVVLVTMERALAVLFPIRYRLLSRPKIAICVTLGTVILILCLCLVFPISVDTMSVKTKYNSTTDVCLFAEESTVVQSAVAWFYTELFVHFGVPFVIIIMCNIIIIVRTTMQGLKYSKPEIRQKLHWNKDDIIKALPVRVIVISLVFCLGVGPIHFFGDKEEKLQFKLPAEADMNNQRYDSADSVYTPVVILIYLNNAVNFVLYCVIGTGFRRDLKKLFRHNARSSIFITEAPRDSEND